MKTKGQSTLEYALIIAVALAGLLAMQHYMRRGVEGKLRSSTDSIGEQYAAGRVTGTIATEKTVETEATDSFGTDTLGVGASRHQVNTPGTTKVYTESGQEEKITEHFGTEKLFE